MTLAFFLSATPIEIINEFQRGAESLISIKSFQEEIVTLKDQLRHYQEQKGNRNALIKKLRARIRDILYWAENTTDRVFVVEHKLSKIPVPDMYIFGNEQKAQECAKEKERNPNTRWVTVNKYIPVKTVNR